ncbi:MAG: sugar transferase [Geminicoccaceae bacterium]|nr:sugar transferase [Geminicoccaceae bacterium]
MVTLAFPFAIILREWPLMRPETFDAMILGTVTLLAITIVTYSILALHRGMWRYATLADLLAAGKFVTLITLVFVPAMFFLDRLSNVPRSVLIIMWLLAIVGLCGSRAVYSRFFARTSMATIGTRNGPPGTVMPILLVGSGDSAELFIHLCERQSDSSSRLLVVGILDDAATPGRTLGGVPILGRLDDFRQNLTRLRVAGVAPSRMIVTRPHSDFDPEALDQLIRRAVGAGLIVDQLPDLLRFKNHSQQDAQGTITSMSVDRDVSPGYFRVKRLVDLAVSSVALICLSPLMLAIVAVVRLALGEPAVFTQLRVGLHGRRFLLHKFRTMRDPAGKDGKLIPDDLRLSRVGSFLRRTRLDELPQLFNVLKGDMSLIGPRPLLEEDQPKVGRSLSVERLSVRPGLTGWAQVNGGQMLTSSQKNALDLFYIHNASPFVDTRIVFLTLRMIVIGEKVNLKEISRAEAVIATG